ncbi:MAG TPA: Hsp20/alpha crystallin family protein [Ignavibacteriales bacterium]|nr:Hsp20/alpha crystallin family protein [Ignavibacteriales bacterium]
MAVIKFEPLKELENFSNRVQRYFEDFPGFGMDLSGAFSPRIDISEDEKHLYVEAELPGIRKEDLKITLHDNILTLRGEKKRVEEQKDKNFYRNERTYGTFTRSFTLPVEVDSDKVDAKFEDGALMIKMEKINPKPVNEKEIKLS